jgi:hypothetical protein
MSNLARLPAVVIDNGTGYVINVFFLDTTESISYLF